MDTEHKIIEVVGGIIRRGDRYLLGKRPLGKSQGGHWKFVSSLDFYPADAELLPVVFGGAL